MIKPLDFDVTIFELRHVNSFGMAVFKTFSPSEQLRFEYVGYSCTRRFSTDVYNTTRFRTIPCFSILTQNHGFHRLYYAPRAELNGLETSCRKLYSLHRGHVAVCRTLTLGYIQQVSTCTCLHHTNTNIKLHHVGGSMHCVASGPNSGITVVSQTHPFGPD